MTFVETLRRERLVAIIRGQDADASLATARALVESGVRLLEVSLTSANAHVVLREIASWAHAGVELGAGTVLTAADVDGVLDCGASFVVTPALAPSVDHAHALGVPVIGGALTPSEIVRACDRGADAVKIFPARIFGPTYLKDLRGPFPDVPFVPVGGVSALDAPAYLANGAAAVGVGSPLCGDAPDGGDLAALHSRVTHFLRQVQP